MCVAGGWPSFSHWGSPGIKTLGLLCDLSVWIRARESLRVSGTQLCLHTLPFLPVLTHAHLGWLCILMLISFLLGLPLQIFLSTLWCPATPESPFRPWDLIIRVVICSH